MLNRYGKLVLKTKKIAFIGGDERMLFAAELFAQNGYRAAVYGFDGASAERFEISLSQSAEEALSGADYAVLPPLVSRDGENIYAPLAKNKIALRELRFGGALVFAGGSCPKIMAETRAYSAEEAFAVRNAVPTAEGALKLAIEATGETVCGMRACVLGFGRIGTVLAKDLIALGASADVFARRNEARALAEALGARARPFAELEAEIGSYDCIFNTVPQRVLGAAALAKIKKGAPFIELASAPGGADRAEALALGVKFTDGGGLPGRVTPKSAGKIIYTTVSEMIEEEGI